MPRGRRSGYNDEQQLSFDALWAEPESERDDKYGRMAMRHWEKTDPDRLRQIPASEREAFFAELGDRAESEIQQLQDRLAGPDPSGEGYLEKVGRLNMARLQAEEQVLPDLILIAGPTPDEEGEGNEAARWHLETMRDRARMRQQDEDE
jgi:hypothetical protein